MCYLRKIEYEIVLKESYFVLRTCSGYGRKTHFKNTGKFRINANGNKLDIWLIYQCENCKHTLNLAIYERQKVSSISKKQYERFLDNDEQLSKMYGKCISLFKKNKAAIDFDWLDYDFVKLGETRESTDYGECMVLTIHNPHELNIRPEKQIAKILDLSRSQVQKMIYQGDIRIQQVSPKSMVVWVNSIISD